jgi:hypothetical protein
LGGFFGGGLAVFEPHCKRGPSETHLFFICAVFFWAAFSGLLEAYFFHAALGNPREIHSCIFP